jgi:adenylyltransferase/sulfurtransferase
MAQPLQITPGDTRAASEDRFHRFGLISWWDQKRLWGARVLVVGAGALGNELIKNLALLGIGNLLIVDRDRIENSNLSRSVLYRESDTGRSKAQTAAAAAKSIFPGLRVHALDLDVVNELGGGAFRWADVVLGGLDNREARLSMNRHCYRLGKPFIDGAIEQIQGVARVFIPETHPLSRGTGAGCYECTMSSRDWQILQHRRSCNLLSRSEMEGGKTPTTPTISSIIAGVQAQEAVKILHGMDTLAGKGWHFEGVSCDAYPVSYQRNPECLSHDPVSKIVPVSRSAAEMTVKELIALARELSGQPRVELGRDIIETLSCSKCGRSEPVFLPAGKVGQSRAACPACGESNRQVSTFSVIDEGLLARSGREFLDRTLASIGVPPLDILLCRGAAGTIGIELSADRRAVLGELADGEEELELL